MIYILKTLARQMSVYARMDLLWFLRDTKYCIMQMLCDIICAFSAVTGVFLLSVRFGGFGGMSQKEVLFMLAYSTMVDGVYTMFFAGNNTGNISRIIGRGQLDHCLIQPVPLWCQLLGQGFAPFSSSVILISGIILCIYALKQLSINITAFWIIGLVISVASSAFIILAVSIIFSCLAFKAPVAAEEISMSVHDLFAELKSYPLGGFSTILQGIFCTAVPVGLTAWFPAKILLGKPGFAPLTAMAAVGFMAFAAYIFRKGMNYYAKNSSPRYSGFGHR